MAVKKKRVQYEVETGGKWQRVNKATVHDSGWLSYELREGDQIITGLARPKKWRERGTGNVTS
jgi:hypothetical protein